MSIKVMNHVWGTSQYGGSDLLLLLALADTASDDGYGFMAVPTLAKKSRMSDRSVQRALKSMEASPHQELALLRNQGPHGCHAFQFLNLPWVTDCRGGRLSLVTIRRGDIVTPKPEEFERAPVVPEEPAQASTGDNLSGCQNVGVTSEAAGVTDLSPIPSLEPSGEGKPKDPPSSLTSFEKHSPQRGEGAGVEMPPRHPRTRPDTLQAQCALVLSHLIAVTGRDFRTAGEIPGCLKRGATVPECCLVIDWWHAVKIVTQPTQAANFNHTTPFRAANFDKYRAEAEVWQAQGRPPPLSTHLSEREQRTAQASIRLLEEYRNGPDRLAGVPRRVK